MDPPECARARTRRVDITRVRGSSPEQSGPFGFVFRSLLRLAVRRTHLDTASALSSARSGMCGTRPRIRHLGNERSETVGRISTAGVPAVRRSPSLTMHCRSIFVHGCVHSVLLILTLRRQINGWPLVRATDIVDIAAGHARYGSVRIAPRPASILPSVRRTARCPFVASLEPR